MRTKSMSLVLAITVVLAASACSKKEGPGSSAAASGVATSAPAAARKPGAMPFDFASGPVTAKAGDYVLVPSKNWIDEAFVKGGEKQTFIYYAATMAQPGAVESKIKTLSGQDATVPNGFIIPIKPAQRVARGDIVLTWWQSGSGMQRSIVVGGTPEEPKVLHLDLDIDNPSGAGKKEDTLKKGSFHTLTASLQPGVTVAAKQGTTYKRWTVTNIDRDKVLVIGFAGSMKVLRKSECIVVPPHGTFAPGADVAVPYIGSFTKGKVEKVDAKIGRVFTKISFGGSDKTIGVGLPDVSPLLPGM